MPPPYHDDSFKQPTITATPEAVAAERNPKPPTPMRMPSPAKSGPLNDCTNAEIIAGFRTASRTAGMVVNRLVRGSSRATCITAKTTEVIRDHVSNRSATALPPPTPSLAMAAGTIVAPVDCMASMTTKPREYIWLVMLYAAAATPLGSMSCAVRVAETKATLSAACLIRMASAPCRRGRSDAARGGRSIKANEASLRRSSSARYTPPESSSASAVASAAPATPSPAPKMSMGSRRRLSTLDARETLRGVTVSRVPRNAAKLTELNSAGTKEMERKRR
mmetsp:Transcript_3523/g.8526  ORF Transcript_3523/g.8526 Transcript_3523/m.8526 type:complete len:278 (+) Transcript_3523:254-1087(+)